MRYGLEDEKLFPAWLAACFYNDIVFLGRERGGGGGIGKELLDGGEKNMSGNFLLVAYWDPNWGDSKS